MRNKKRIIILLVICLVTILMLVACGNKETDKPLVEQIDEQLAGTWISEDTDTVTSKWTFHEGQYVVDTYVDGVKIGNSTIGTYSIGSEAIHTITADQKNNIEGSIPFSFIDGKLTLHGATGTLMKEE